MKNLLLTLTMLPLLTFGQDNFCIELESKNFVKLSKQIDTYFINNSIDTTSKYNQETKFTEVDSLISFLSDQSCTDTVKYRLSRGFIMKSIPPMADILISQNTNGIQYNYIIRLQFDNRTKVVFFRDWKK
jgi:hypothetical protein